VLGTPNRYYVITTAIYQLVHHIRRSPGCRRHGVSLFAVMFFICSCTGAS